MKPVVRCFVKMPARVVFKQKTKHQVNHLPISLNQSQSVKSSQVKKKYVADTPELNRRCTYGRSPESVIPLALTPEFERI